LSYIEQSLTQGERVVHLGRFHWIYLAGALFWIFMGVIGCCLIMGGAIAFEVKQSLDTMYSDLSPQLFSQAWPDVVESKGGYVAMIRDTSAMVRLGAFGVMLFGMYLFAHMMIVRATTEIAVTTHRFVLKEGIVARNVDEINIDRIESVHVMQSVMGRILGYGSVMVRGMGVGEIFLPPVADPIILRNAIDHARQQGEKKDVAA
jgi:hypothetical protein